MKKTYCWEDITVEQFEQMQRVLNTDEYEEIDKQCRLAAIVMHNDEQESDYLYDLTISELKEELSCLKFMSDQFLPRMLDNGKYTINGKEYELIHSVKHMTAAQYMDYEHCLKSGEVQNIVACVLIPKGHQYNDGYNISDIKKDIYHYFPIVDALGIAAFFLKTFEVSSQLCLTYLNKQIKKAMKNEQDEKIINILNESMLKIQDSVRLLVKNGVG